HWSHITADILKYVLKVGDIVIAMDGSLVGRSFAMLSDNDVPSLLLQRVARIRSENIVQGYLKAWICSNYFTDHSDAVKTVTAIPHISPADIKAFKIALPPTKAEQQAIAEALGDADALIESLEQLLAKKRLLKQGAMQELLTGKRRLPRFKGDWRVRRLGELSEIRAGGTPSTTQPQFWDGDIPWCIPTDITKLKGNKYLTATDRKISHAGLKSSSAEIIPANSIIMTSRATIGECAINRIPVATNQGFKNFIPFSDVDLEFFYYLLQTQKNKFIGLCSGSTFLEIGKIALTLFEVYVPKEKTEQTAIAAILADMDLEIDAIETQLAKTRQLKQGMMQELLTGRIRLI
ncbi:MAG: restriction endonuclease subunit S, partial [Calditrichaeota bacterium]|nr:restriction endonuclease subunit S [Calditrichota bacterium]